ncbi:hypothetical protein CEXT_103551 [Caerostris extrusa]|uniref:Uncharacterized protein n=1 Tax=Caerostris extrusa TaxID=172846 RepID=A0AAV4R2G5_CAEEX|nr:hypothetical protein CEXT_103551 [Caerostris extrusa]
MTYPLHHPKEKENEIKKKSIPKRLCNASNHIPAVSTAVNCVSTDGRLSTATKSRCLPSMNFYIDDFYKTHTRKRMKGNDYVESLVLKNVKREN